MTFLHVCANIYSNIARPEADLQQEKKMSAERIHRQIRERRYPACAGAGSPPYLAAVLEYLAAEILELADVALRNNNINRIIPRHISLATRNDQELNTLLYRHELKAKNARNSAT